MNENYHKKLEKLIEKIKEEQITPKLLLHSCCAPCSSYVIEYLTPYFDITILYYNPNISPIEEYEKRKKEQIKLIKDIKTTNKINIIDCDYDNDIYEKEIKGLENEKEGGPRCIKCFNLRLEKTAEIAKNNNYDYFCTTLTVSPYKNSKLLGYKLGCEIAKLFERPNVNYLVPVPLHIDSTRKYNQAYEIARGLGHVWNIKIFNETAWTKIVQRRALLGVAERKLLSEDAFKITGDLNNLKISIVDDVCTTGTTLLNY